MTFVKYVVLAVAAIPFVYYLIALYSSWQFFRLLPRRDAPKQSFTPPVSSLKPVRGLDPDAQENLASFCRQHYPEYELLFCVDEGALKIDAGSGMLLRRIRSMAGSETRRLYRSEG